MDPVALLGSAMVAGGVTLAFAVVRGSDKTGSALAGLRSEYAAKAAATARELRRRPARATAFAGRLARPRNLETLRRALQVADAPAEWTVERLVLAKLALAGGLGTLGLLQFLAAPGGKSLVALVLLVAVGYLGPDRVVLSRASRSRDVFRAEVPDMVDQLAVVVRAGLGLDAAIVRLASSTDGPVGRELARVVQDIRVGVPRAEALRLFAERADIPEVTTFVRALVQSDKLGVPIAGTLEIQAEEMRLKRRQLSEERAMKLPVKILLPTVFCILPALLLVVLGPAAVSLYDSLIAR